ncbi:ABC transporter ATP-binding protein [Candidatus Woesearchaeota archaeon]|nr:ABC transporter ATP-binding protein [Candidatus Woesearchaeota archaeon]
MRKNKGRKDKERRKDKEMIAIRIRNLSKKFLIPHEKRKTLAESIIGAITRGRVKYEEFYALRNINLDVKKGEFVGIIGPNGSGKTTLLKVIAGILEPDKGSIEVNSRIIPFLELGIGFVPDLTAKENICLYGSLLGLGKSEIGERFDSIVDFAEIRKFVDTPLKDFSTGMLARLAFSIAKDVDGDIYLVDEVLSVGDEDFRKKCVAVFEEFKRQGKTVLFVTHDHGLSESICNRIVALKDGRVSEVKVNRKRCNVGNPVSDGKSDMKIYMAQDRDMKLVRKQDRQLHDSYADVRGLQGENLTMRQQLEMLEKSFRLEKNKNVRLQNECREKNAMIELLQSKPKSYESYKALFNSKERLGSGEVRVETVQIRDGQGTERESFKPHEPLTIHILCKARESIESPEVGIAITDSDCVFVAGPNNKDVQGPRRMARGMHSFQFRIGSIPLNPGQYRVHVGLNKLGVEGVENGYDFLANAALFEIIGDEDDGEHDREHIGETFGFLSLKGEWTHHEER